MNRKRTQQQANDDGGISYESAETNIICKYCGEHFLDHQSKHYHSELVHKDQYLHQCTKCTFKTQALHLYITHCAKQHGETLPARTISEQEKVKRSSYQRRSTVTQRQASFNGALLHQKLKYISGKDQKDMHAAMNEFRPKIKEIMINYEKDKGPSKCYLSLVPHFVKYDQDGNIVEHQKPYFNSTTTHITNVQLEFQHFYDRAIQKIWSVMEQWLKGKGV